MHNSLRETIETEVQTHVEDYGDLVVQNLATRAEVSAGALPQAIPFNELISSYDVLGDIDRYGADEAVLLAQKLRSLDVSLHGTFTAEATVEFDYRFGFSGEPIRYAVADESDNINDGNNVVIVGQNDVDNDRLYQASGQVEAGHRDTANSTAAGASPFRVTDETNYMNEVGVLPEVSARETLFERWNVQSGVAEDPEDGALYLHSNWQLYWLETDDEVEARQIDVV